MRALLLLTFLSFIELGAVVIRDPSGEIYYLEVPPDVSLEDVVNQFQQESGYTSEPLIDFMALKEPARLNRQSSSLARNYFAPLSSSEKEDIIYIVTTLGMASLTKIASSKSTLKKVGSHVDHIHPLNFLWFIFHNEKNRASFHALKDRNWIWDEFKDGLIGSLAQESDAHNLKDEYVIDFSAKLSLDSKEILPLIQKKEWSQLLKTLSKLLPRQGDPNRYSM